MRIDQASCTSAAARAGSSSALSSPKTKPADRSPVSPNELLRRGPRPRPSPLQRNLMKRLLLLVLCASLPACALLRRPPRPIHAPPPEAASLEFPFEPRDLEGSVSVTGTLFVAMQLAMEDFLPW